jgi:DNA invertase Pin-like site-specific DNA recombinase
MEHALGYLRTSSIANVGEDKDSDKRQRTVIEAGAARAGYQIVDWFYGAGVSGEVEIADRTGFAEMLDRIEGNGVRTVFVESADRFARKMLTAELGIVLLISRGVTLMTAAGENLTSTDDEMRVAFRQIAMAFAQLEKTRLVKKLRGARDRRSIEVGRRIEGRKGYTRGNGTLVALAKSLAAGNTLLATSAALAERGYRTASGKPFSASQVKRLIQARDMS